MVKVAEIIRQKLVFIIILLALALMFEMGFFDFVKISKGFSNVFQFIKEMLPLNISDAKEVLGAVLETLKMAYVGTLLGFIFSIPLSLLAARNIFGGLISFLSRFLLSLIRVIPSLLLAIIFVVAFGLGPLAGTLALAIYTMNYLGKLFYETFEAVDKEVLEVLEATGVSKIQKVLYAILPESSNYILSQIFFMFEYNIRASTILGFVGAGGIGFYMMNYIQTFQYNKLTTALVFTLIVVLTIDYVSGKIREKILRSN